MQYDTAGNPIIFYDICAYCDLDTGGNHQHWCPCYQVPIPQVDPIELELDWRWEVEPLVSGGKVSERKRNG